MALNKWGGLNVWGNLDSNHVNLNASPVQWSQNIALGYTQIQQKLNVSIIEQITFIDNVQLNAAAIYSANKVEQVTYISRANIDVASIYSCQAIEYPFLTSANDINVEQQFTTQAVDYFTKTSVSAHRQQLNFATVAIEQTFAVSTAQMYLGALPELDEIDWDNVALYSTTPKYKMISTTPNYILTRG